MHHPDPDRTGANVKLKLDENFDVRLVPELLKEGFDADTVIAEGLAGLMKRSTTSAKQLAEHW